MNEIETYKDEEPKGELRRRLTGALIMCVILFILLCFASTHNYVVTKEHNNLIKDYNGCTEQLSVYEPRIDHTIKPTLEKYSLGAIE